MNAPVIPAERWNQLVAGLERGTPLGGVGCKVTRTPEGALLSARGADDWNHPWKLSARWQPADKPAEGMPPGEWRVSVRPGFVNGRDATINSELPKPGSKETERLEVPLTDEPPPYLVISGWRNPLKSAGLVATLAGDLITLPAEGYPPFFKKLGVKEPERGSRETDSVTPDPARTRELRACDVALITPRISVRTEITILDPFANQQVVDMNSAFDDSAFRRAKSAFRLVAMPKWEPPQEPTMLDRLLGTDVEPQTDEIKIATLWIVSPPDAGTDDFPDGTWQPYPQHFVFWNLTHEARRPPPETPFQPLRFFLPLAGGIAQPVIDSILAPINDAYAAIHNALKETTFKGEFWTI